MKKIFIQNWGTYQNETLVCIGVNIKEIKYYCMRNKLIFNNNVLHTLEKNINKTLLGFVLVNDDGTSFLWLKEFKNKWKYYETLMHELHHLVFIIFGNKLMESEMEAQAYQFEYLFREIRKNLTKETKNARKIKTKSKRGCLNNGRIHVQNCKRIL